jgi:hypothetical protein
VTLRKRITLAILSCVGITVGAYLALTAPPSVNWEALDSAAQKYRVEIARDYYGIPHIFGHSDADTAFGRDLVASFTFKSPLFYGFDKVLGELMSGTPRELALQGDEALTFLTWAGRIQ